MNVLSMDLNALSIALFQGCFIFVASQTKTIRTMKNFLFVLLCLPLFAFSQEEPEANLFEVVNIYAKPGENQALEKAIKAHNEKYHPEGDYHAQLYYNINGPDGGSYAWIMGPTSWTAMDDRPAKGDHDADWAKIEEMARWVQSPGYWGYSSSLSYDNGEASPSKRLIWVYDIKRNQGRRWAELIEKVKKVHEEKRPTESFWVYWNKFATGSEGKDAAIIFPFENWSWMDRDSKFSKDFEAVHGENTWEYFLDEFRSTIDSRVDIIRERVD